MSVQASVVATSHAAPESLSGHKVLQPGLDFQHCFRREVGWPQTDRWPHHV